MLKRRESIINFLKIKKFGIYFSRFGKLWVIDARYVYENPRYENTKKELFKLWEDVKNGKNEKTLFITFRSYKGSRNRCPMNSFNTPLLVSCLHEDKLIRLFRVLQLEILHVRGERMSLLLPPATYYTDKSFLFP